MIWLFALPRPTRHAEFAVASQMAIVMTHEENDLVGTKILKWIGCWWVHGTEGREQERRQKGAALRRASHCFNCSYSSKRQTLSPD